MWQHWRYKRIGEIIPGFNKYPLWSRGHGQRQADADQMQCYKWSGKPLVWKVAWSKNKGGKATSSKEERRGCSSLSKEHARAWRHEWVWEAVSTSVRLEYWVLPVGRGENLPGILGGQKQRTWLEEKVKFKLTRRINPDTGSCVTETRLVDWTPPQQALPLDLQAGLCLREALTPLSLVRELRHLDLTINRGSGFLGNQNQYLQRLGSLGEDSVEMQ